MSDRAHAIDAFCSAIHAEPKLVRSSRALGGLCVCSWTTPDIQGFELPGTDELIIALHRGGSHDVRAQAGGARSRSRSIPGMLTLIPPGQRVAYYTGGNVTFTTVHIGEDALQEILGFHGSGPMSIHERFAFRDPFVTSCIESLLNERASPNRWSARFVGAVTEALLLRVLGDTRQTEEPSELSIVQRINSVKERIEADLAGNISLAALAAEARMSRAHFARTFHEIVGEAPHRYVLSRRLHRAMELLSTGAAALSDIAYETGFCSQSHFTRVFRKQTGVTPQQYRQRRHLTQ